MFFIREEIVNAFKKGIFPYIDGFQVEKETDEDADEEMDTTIMPELESEESTKKCRKKKSTRKRLKNFNTKPNAN